MRYLLIDTSNVFFRAKHVAHRGSTLDEKIGFTLHTILASVAKCWREQKADHVVFFLEGRSWRKSFYPPYKLTRKIAKEKLTPKEQKEDEAFWKAYEDLTEFLSTNTNCSVIRHPELEADDLISGWIQAHRTSEHIIISTDSDFTQLLAENVKLYNGVSGELWTIDGIFDYKGKRVLDKKTKEPKEIPDPEYLLFEKCIRGDTSDNVFSAYPGVREKSTKSSGKIGLREAFNDRNKKGFAWNNFMLQKWADHNKVEHTVLKDYERNRMLIDLKHQPDQIKTLITDTIKSHTAHKKISMVGARFLKFCGKWELIKLSDNATIFGEILSRGYTEFA